MFNKIDFDKMMREYNRLYSEMLKHYTNQAIFGTSTLKIEVDPSLKKDELKLTGKGDYFITIPPGHEIYDAPITGASILFDPGSSIKPRQGLTLAPYGQQINPNMNYSSQDDFSIGDKVRRRPTPFSPLYAAKDTNLYTVAEVNGLRFRVKETGVWEYQNEFEYDFVATMNNHSLKCECGSDSVEGVGHSSYCPKFE